MNMETCKILVKRQYAPKYSINNLHMFVQNLSAQYINKDCVKSTYKTKKFDGKSVASEQKITGIICHRYTT